MNLGERGVMFAGRVKAGGGCDGLCEFVGEDVNAALLLHRRHGGCGARAEMHRAARRRFAWWTRCAPPHTYRREREIG